MVKRILSLDGGGVRSIIQAQILNDLYPGLSGHQILKKFHVVTATSTGSVILAGLLENRYPYDMFEDFQTRSFLDALYSRTCWPFFRKWSTRKKYDGLLRKFPKSKRTLWEISKASGLERIILPAYDVQKKISYVFDSLETGGQTYLDAMHATTTSPFFYFDHPAQVGTRTYWDGSMSSLSDPAVYATAVMRESYPKEDIHTLSIGCGMFIPDVPHSKDPSQYYPNIRETLGVIAGVVSGETPDVSSRCLNALTAGNYVRINPVVGPDFTLPYPILPNVFYRDTTLGGSFGHEKLVNAPLITKDLDLIEKLICVGSHYLDGNIPTQIVPRITDATKTIFPDKTYAGLKKSWLDLEKL